MVAGFMGGTPATGVLIRTALNISSGATHMTSQFICGFAVLVIMTFLTKFFAYLPMPIIASILLNMALRLVPFEVRRQRPFWGRRRRPPPRLARLLAPGLRRSQFLRDAGVDLLLHAGGG